MPLRTIARSISRPVRDRLCRRLSIGQVLAVFEHACHLIDHESDVVALVTPHIGDGPLNIVVDGTAGLFSRIEPGMPVTLRSDQLVATGLQVDLRQASVWEPRPNWGALRARRAAIESRLPLLRTLCLRHAPAGSLLALVGAPRTADALVEATSSTAEKAAAVLREGWEGDPDRLREGTARLAGLGSGLTPSGDDFLAGAMLWAWLAHPAPDSVCCTIGQVAAPRTTALSTALLRATARGECSTPWHRLLVALSEGPDARIAAAVREVLAHGATSGADTLSGFLYLGA